MTQKVNKGGRPTAYREEYNERVTRYALLGLSDLEMAGLFGVSEQTFNAWKNKYPAFLEALLEGKEEADAKVARALYNRATGYEYNDVHVSVYQGDVTETPVTRHVSPDTGAAALWLKNRRSSKWRDRQEIALDMSDSLLDKLELARRRVEGSK